MTALSDAQKNDFMYYKLVKNDNDLVGQIAYAYYKKSKIEHIEDYRKKHNFAPDHNELLTWQGNHGVNTHVKMYREKAEKELSTFSQVLTTEKEDKLLKEKKDIEDKIREFKKLKKDAVKRDKLCHVKSYGWFLSSLISIIENIVSSFIFVGVSILILFAVSKNTDLISRFWELVTQK